MWKFLVKLKVRDFQVPLQFLRNFRSRIAYNRWWEGGTLLQQTRGEWFNGFSSLIVLAPVQIPKIE
jgi:predicted membrane chloride channel (bestrophin family)